MFTLQQWLEYKAKRAEEKRIFCEGSLEDLRKLPAYDGLPEGDLSEVEVIGDDQLFIRVLATADQRHALLLGTALPHEEKARRLYVFGLLSKACAATPCQPCDGCICPCHNAG